MPHLVPTPRPTRVEALGGFELVWVGRGVEIVYVMFAPPGFGGGELFVCLCDIKLASTKEAAGGLFVLETSLNKKKKIQTGEWHRREMLVCLPWTACRDVQPRGSVSSGRVRSYVRVV